MRESDGLVLSVGDDPADIAADAREAESLRDGSVVLVPVSVEYWYAIAAYARNRGQEDYVLHYGRNGRLRKAVEEWLDVAWDSRVIRKRLSAWHGGTMK